MAWWRNTYSSVVSSIHLSLHAERLLSTRRRAQLGLASALTVLAVAVATLLFAPRVSKPVRVADVGTLAPNFQLAAVAANVTLSDLHGQAVVLFFYSHRSPIAAEYNTRIDRLASTYSADARVTFLGLDVDASTPDLRSAEQHAFTALADQNGAVARRYSVRDLPTVVVIDAHGVVRYRGAFDNNADLAFATRSFAAEALRNVLDSSTVAVAGK
jgi:peroxiredoxin